MSRINSKTYFRIKFISCVSEKCPKTEPERKNCIKFADIFAKVMRAMSEGSRSSQALSLNSAWMLKYYE